MHDPRLLLSFSHTEHVSIYTTFGEAIDIFCRRFGIREEDWQFIGGKRADGSYVEIDKQDTEHACGISDNDDVILYCIPRDTNN